MTTESTPDGDPGRPDSRPTPAQRLAAALGTSAIAPTIPAAADEPDGDGS